MAITTEGELMDKIVTLCKRRGFVFQSSEIYGGFNGFWDYGPYGTAMKKAIEQLGGREITKPCFWSISCPFRQNFRSNTGSFFDFQVSLLEKVMTDGSFPSFQSISTFSLSNV